MNRAQAAVAPLMFGLGCRRNPQPNLHDQHNAWRDDQSNRNQRRQSWLMRLQQCRQAGKYGVLIAGQKKLIQLKVRRDQRDNETDRGNDKRDGTHHAEPAAVLNQPGLHCGSGCRALREGVDPSINLCGDGGQHDRGCDASKK